MKNTTHQLRPSFLRSKTTTLLLISSLFFFQGCAAAIIGLGAAGGGAFAYYNGKLTKTYESEYHKTVQASSATLKKLKIPITDTIKDELKTVIKAKRPDGTPVTIEVQRVDPKNSQVSVRTGTVGVWDRRVSEQIHGFISEALGVKAAAAKPPAKAEDSKEVEQHVAKQVEAALSQTKPAETSEPAATQASAATSRASSSLKEKRLRAGQILADSAFVIFFEPNSNELTPTAIKKLDRIYEILSNDPQAVMALNGYSDSYGSSIYNQMISEIRAKSVKSYLANKGLEPSRMTTFGHGAQKFIATNSTAEGRSMNRRVEIEIVNSDQ